MENLPVPHPESDEILRQKSILDSDLTVERLIYQAAGGAGTEPAVPAKSWSVDKIYTAHDSSDHPVFRDAFGGEVRDVDAYNRTDVRSVLTPDGGSVRAVSTYNVVGGDHVGGTYPINVGETFQRFDQEGKLRDVVDIKLAWNGEYYNPKVMLTKHGEAPRELSGDEELDVKTQIANAFGLNYDVIARPLAQREDVRFEVEPEAKHRVDNMAAELMLKGLVGNELRVALLKQLHPDTQPQDTENNEEAFKYASSLDYEKSGTRPVNIKPTNQA